MSLRAACGVDRSIVAGGVQSHCPDEVAAKREGFRGIAADRGLFSPNGGTAGAAFPELPVVHAPGKVRHYGDLLSRTTGVSAANVQISGRAREPIAQIFQSFERLTSDGKALANWAAIHEASAGQSKPTTVIHKE